MKIITRVAFTTVAIAVITVVSILVLVPQITHPTPPSVLLDETVTLTESFYEKEYNLQFTTGEKLNIRIISYGQPVDFQITNPNGTIIDNGEIISDIYQRELIVTIEGNYTFYVGASTGTPKVRIIIARQ